MNGELEKNLISGMDSLEKGDSIESVLARYPGQAADLRPLLETAAQLSQLASQPTVGVQQQSQTAFLADAAVLRSPQSPSLPIWFLLRRLMRPLASLAVILLLLGFGMVTMSASALPGDGLYQIKRGIEEFRLMRASDSEQILNLSDELQQERLREIEALLRAGRRADVLFEGDIEAIDSTAWIVAGLPVQIESGTIIEGVPRVGELARVDARTFEGRLIAGHISVLTGTADSDEFPRPALVPTIEATPTARPSRTPAVTETPSMSATPSTTTEPQVTPMSDSGESAVPAATATAVAVDPNATLPSSIDNDDDQSNDNDNDIGADDGDDNGDDNENDGGGDDGDDNENDGGDDGGDENENGDGGETGDDNGDDNDNEDGGDDSGDGNDNEDGGDDSGDGDGNEDGGDESGDDNDNEEDENSNEDDGDSGDDNDNENEDQEENSGEDDSDEAGDNDDVNDNT